MATKSKLNFRVIENYSPDVDFEEFERDFLNCMTKKELMKKYDLSIGYWKEFRDKVYEKHPHMKRRTGGRIPIIRERHRVCDDTGSYIKRSEQGNWTIYRRHNNKLRSYGSYSKRDTAEMVRGELVKYNWNKYVAYDLIKDYAMLVSRRCLLSRILVRDE